MLRGTKNWSQVELSEVAKVSRDIISRLENGTAKNLMPKTIGKLAKAFDMPVEEFQKWVS